MRSTRRATATRGPRGRPSNSARTPCNYPIAPFVLGLVLGDILDKSLRRGLQITNGDLTPFFTRPVCALLAAVTLFTLLMYMPPINRRVHAGWASLVRSFRGMLAR